MAEKEEKAAEEKAAATVVAAVAEAAAVEAETVGVSRFQVVVLWGRQARPRVAGPPPVSHGDATLPRRPMMLVREWHRS